MGTDPILEVDGTATKLQPDPRLTTSAGEKEKRKQSGNEQPNLKNWEVPTKKKANTSYRHKVNC